MQIDRCFGFDTAVEESQRALLAAKVEARSAYNGLGLVRLMGRSSGYIAMQASMASGACCPRFGALGSRQPPVFYWASRADGPQLGLHRHAGLHGFRYLAGLALRV